MTFLITEGYTGTDGWETTMDLGSYFGVGSRRLVVDAVSGQCA